MKVNKTITIDADVYNRMKFENVNASVLINSYLRQYYDLDSKTQETDSTRGSQDSGLNEQMAPTQESRPEDIIDKEAEKVFEELEVINGNS